MRFAAAAAIMSTFVAFGAQPAGASPAGNPDGHSYLITSTWPGYATQSDVWTFWGSGYPGEGPRTVADRKDPGAPISWTMNWIPKAPKDQHLQVTVTFQDTSTYNCHAVWHAIVVPWTWAHRWNGTMVTNGNPGCPTGIGTWTAFMFHKGK